MALPTGQRAIWDVTRRVLDSFTGNAMQIRDRAGNLTNIGFVQEGASPAGSDPVDISAIETAANGDGAWVYILYDHSGNNHDLTLRGTGGAAQNQMYWRVCDNNGNALLDENGNLQIELDFSDPDTFSDFNIFFGTGSSLGGITTNTQFGVWKATDVAGTIVGNLSDPRPYIGAYDQNDTGGRIDRDSGATEFQLNWYKDGVQFATLGGTVYNKDELYTQFQTRSYYSITGGIFNQSPDASPQDNFALFKGDNEQFEGIFQSYMIYPTDISASRTDVEDYYNTELFTEVLSGAVTYDSNAVEGATVDLISVDQVGGAEAVAETGLTTQADGTVTASVARDGAKEYYFRVYPFNLPISGLTGTLTATDATNLNLGVNLSALDTGQNRAYTIKATGGTGSGEVVLITEFTDKANGLVTVTYHPFGNDTTFEVCRLISGENASVLPRES